MGAAVGCEVLGAAVVAAVGFFVGIFVVGAVGCGVGGGMYFSHSNVGRGVGEPPVPVVVGGGVGSWVGAEDASALCKAYENVTV